MLKNPIEAVFIALLLMIVGQAVGSAREIVWPEKHGIQSGSPNGRYGVLIPESELDKEEAGGPELPNYLVDIKAHRVLGVILNSTYVDGKRRRYLNVFWAADSTWCVVENEERFGVMEVTAIDLRGPKMLQYDIGDLVLKRLDGEIAKETNDRKASGFAYVFFRLGPGRKIQVCAVSRSNAKFIENSKCSFFRGGFDLTVGKWTDTYSRSVSQAAYEALSMCDLDIKDTEFASEQRLDEWLNAFYTGLKGILPNERFAALKRQQIAWLNKRDRAATEGERRELLKIRVRELLDMIW